MLDSLTGRETALVGSLVVGAVFGWGYLSRSRQKRLLPPGPAPLPIIGNLFDLPHTQQWRVYREWGQLYGDIIHLQVPGQHLVIVNSTSVAEDLLDRRGTVYSDRYHPIMAHDLMGWSWSLAFMAYGDIWRQDRRMLHEQVNNGVVSKYQGIHLRSTRKFLQSLLVDSKDLPAISRQLFAATVMDIAYGYEVAEKGDNYIAVAEELFHALARSFLPGSYLVDAIPMLRHVPSWMPGAGFQKVAARSRALQEQMLDRPFNAVKEEMSRGDAKRCMVTSLLDDPSQQKEVDIAHEERIKRTAANIYSGGSDTTVSTVTTFFLAMARYPEVQKKAQREIDGVVGHDRLPEFSDKSRLPYIHAIMLECLRWQPVLPLVVPHKTIADDEYRGYFIPKGTLVIANTWAILHNPDDYPDPEEFIPERYLKQTPDGHYEVDKSARDPRTAAFGFGRRICPGIHLAEQSIYAVISNVLAAYTISPIKDAAGVPQPPKVEMAPGSISHPLPFEVDIKPRSQRSEELIQQPLPERGL